MIKHIALWFVVFAIFVLLAYIFAPCYPEVSAAIIGVMGVVLTSAFFTLPREIEKYRQTSALEKRHEAYRELCCILHKIVIILLSKDNKEVFSEEKVKYLAEEFFQKFNFEAMYFSEPIQEELRIIYNEVTTINDFYKGVKKITEKQLNSSIDNFKIHSNKITEICRSELGLNKLQEK